MSLLNGGSFVNIYSLLVDWFDMKEHLASCVVGVIRREVFSNFVLKVGGGFDSAQPPPRVFQVVSV